MLLEEDEGHRLARDERVFCEFHGCPASGHTLDAAAAQGRKGIFLEVEAHAPDKSNSLAMTK